MCWMAAIPIAMAGAQALSSQNSADKARVAQTEAGRRQAMEMVKEMNIQNANASLEQRDALEAASSELTSRNMQKVQAMGTIRAAIGESMLEGESMKRIKRIEEGNYIREANSVTENYRRDYASIFAQQLGRTQSTASQVDAMYKSEAKGKSGLMRVLDPLSIIGQEAASQYAAGGFDKKGGNQAAPISAAKGTKTGR